MNKLKLLAVLPLAAGAVMLGAQAANAAAPSVSVSPTSGPNNGTVTVTASGFTGTPQILQCKSKPSTDISDVLAKCNTSALHTGTKVTFKLNPSFCSATECVLLAGTQSPQVSVTTSYKIAAASSGSSDSNSNSGSSDTGAGSTTADPTVNAGTGGQADREGVPAGVIAIAAIGAVAIAGGAIRFARR